MRTDKKKAITLRLAGKSYSEIQQTLSISKGTLSSWLKKIPLSPAIQTRLETKSRRNRIIRLTDFNQQKSRVALTQSKELRKRAAKTISPLSFHELTLVGTLIYWTEGYKKPLMKNGKVHTSHSVRITNTNPNIIRLFIRFTQEVGGIPLEKIRLTVSLRESQDIVRTSDFWTRYLGLPGSAVRVRRYTTSKSSSYPHTPYGAAQVIISNTALYHTLMGFIDGLAHQA